jgi:Kef-type K+ transport system membrane component KefB
VRRVFVVLALLAMMAGLDALKLEMGDASPLTLAAIGLALLASFALAELGARLSLPKVTGYLVGGVVLGPFAADVISHNVVDELEVFGNLALGLIATTAGLELDLRAIVARRITISSTIGIKVMTCAGFVGGSLLVLELWTNALGLPSSVHAWSLALVFAALALATSPSIVVAVSSDLRAKGPLTDLVLSTVVLKDLVVGIGLAGALAGANALLELHAIDTRLITNVLEELGASVIAGAVLGGILIGLLRVVRGQMLIFVGAMVFVVAEIGSFLHLKLLLVFIVAGIVVRTFSNHEAALRKPLRTISLPVFIVFFTSLGASVDLSAFAVMLPVAIVVFAARAVSYWVAGRVGGALGDEPYDVRRFAWLGYLPQAEVSLGLVAMAAASMPEMTTTISTLGVSVVTANLLLGPVALKLALHRAGEVSQGGAGEGSARTDGETEERRSPHRPKLAPRLQRIASMTRDDLERTWQTWQTDVLTPAVTKWAELLSLPSSSNRDVAAEVMDRLDRVPACDGEQRLQDVRGALTAHLTMLERLPQSERVPLERELAEPGPADPGIVRLYKRIAWLGAVMTGRSRRRLRAVPVRLLARTSIEPRLVRVAEETLRDWQRFEVIALEVLQRAVLGTASGPEANRDLHAATESFVQKVRDNIDAAIDAGMQEYVGHLASAGAPGVSAHAYRYSRVEGEITSALHRIEEDALAWSVSRTCAVSTLRFIARVEHAQHQLVRDIVRDVAAPLDEAFAAAQRIVEEEQQRLDALPQTTTVSSDDEAWERLALRAKAVLPKPVLKELRAADNRVRRATSSSAPMSGLLAFLDDRAEAIQMVPSLHQVVIAARPAMVGTVLVDVRQLKEVQIAGLLLPSLERALADVGDAFTQVRETTKEVAKLVDVGFEASHRARSAEDPEGLTKLDEAVEQAATLLTGLRDQACAAWTTERTKILSNVAKMSNRMFEALLEAAGGAASPGSLPSQGERLWGRMRHLLEATFGRWRRWTRRLHLAEAGQAAEDLAHLYRLRAGLHRFDAQAIRALVAEQEALRRSELEDGYASLFSREPLRDPRFLVANGDVLATVLAAERAWQAKPEQGNGVLIVGPSGSGKSSMVGVARLRVSSRRVLVVRPAIEGDTSVFAAVAHALGTEASTEALTRILQSQRSVVILDDLHAWFSPTPTGVDELEAFLALIATTQASTFWIASMPAEAFEVWSETVPLEHAFASIPRLGRVGHRDMEAVLTTRHDLSGLSLAFPSTLGTRLAWRFLRRSARTSFVRHLTAASHGNLRRAMELWQAHARAENDMITLRPLHTLGWGLAFVRQLGPRLKAILGALVCHGALDESTLARCLGAEERDMRQKLRFLVAAGLVERLPACGRFAVLASVRDDLVHALAQDGVIAGGKA